MRQTRRANSSRPVSRTGATASRPGNGRCSGSPARWPECRDEADGRTDWRTMEDQILLPVSAAASADSTRLPTSRVPVCRPLRVRIPYRRGRPASQVPRSVPIWDDIRDVGVEPATRAPKPPGRTGTRATGGLHSVAGPTPVAGGNFCQDLSVAGRRAGFEELAPDPASSSSSPGSSELFSRAGSSGKTSQVSSRLQGKPRMPTLPHASTLA